MAWRQEGDLAPCDAGVCLASLSSLLQAVDKARDEARDLSSAVAVPGLTGDPSRNFAWLPLEVRYTQVSSEGGDIGLSVSSPVFSAEPFMTKDLVQTAKRCVVGLLEILKQSHYLFWEPDCQVDLLDSTAYARDRRKLSVEAFLWLTAALDWARLLVTRQFPYAPHLAYVSASVLQRKRGEFKKTPGTPGAPVVFVS